MQSIRLAEKPIIQARKDTLAGDNVNGPSLIRVPDWVKGKLGKYYLYFAHHEGNSIRLAYADTLTGPWHICTSPPLHLDETTFCDHIASPDVHIDEAEQRILMYFHGRQSHNNTRQSTALATSEDGLLFKQITTPPLGGPYWRAFRFDNHIYILEKPGRLLRSKQWEGPFEVGPSLLAKSARHSALHLDAHTLYIFYSIIGDRPEHIVWSSVSLGSDWTQWRASAPLSLLKPERTFEGSQRPLQHSKSGLAEQAVRELRDPCIFTENKENYLLYSVAGEQGIAIAKLNCTETSWEKTMQKIKRTEQGFSERIHRFNTPIFNKSKQIWRARQYLYNKHARRIRITAAPTFIVGCGHSGTSLLLAAMSAHSQFTAIPRESGIARNPDPDKFKKTIDDFNRLTISEGKHRWVEKTPNHILHLDTILSNSPDAKIIIILRNGLDVAASIKARTGSAIEGAQRWLSENLEGQRFWEHPNVIRIKYEDLITDFDTTMTRVFHFLGETFEPQVRDYHSTERKWYSDRISKPRDQGKSRHNQHRNWQINQPLFDGRNKWKTLSESELSEVEKITAPLLKELGYARSDQSEA